MAHTLLTRRTPTTSPATSRVQVILVCLRCNATADPKAAAGWVTVRSPWAEPPARPAGVCPACVDEHYTVEVADDEVVTA